MEPLFVFGILDGLGFGEKVLVGGIMLLVVLYMFRARSMAGRSANAASTVWIVIVALASAAAVAVFLGWVDPFPNRFLTDILSWVQAAIQFLLGPVDDFLSSFAP